jgi:hypothetical protein
MIFKRDIFYIRLYEGKIDIRNPRDSKSTTFIPKKRYSNERLIIADYETAEIELRSALKYHRGKSFFYRLPIIIFQPIHDKISEYSEVEKRVFRDSSEHCGAKRVYLFLGKELLNDEKILTNLFTKNTLFE